MAVTEDVLRKLARLKAKENNLQAMGSEAALNEAKEISRKIQELCLRERISMTDVEIAQQKHENPVGEDTVLPEAEKTDWKLKGMRKRKRVWWQERLAGVVAHAFCCRILITQGSNKVWFVGRHLDREQAVYTYSLLAYEAARYAADEYDRLHQQARRSGNDRAHLRGWKDSFFRAFCLEMDNRLHAQEQAVMDTLLEGERERGTHLIHLQRKAVEDYLEEKFKNRRGSNSLGAIGSAGSSNTLGAEAGRKFAREVGIRKGVETRRTRQLGSGE